MPHWLTIYKHVLKTESAWGRLILVIFAASCCQMFILMCLFCNLLCEGITALESKHSVYEHSLERAFGSFTLYPQCKVLFFLVVRTDRQDCPEFCKQIQSSPTLPIYLSSATAHKLPLPLIPVGACHLSSILGPPSKRGKTLWAPVQCTDWTIFLPPPSPRACRHFFFFCLHGTASWSSLWSMLWRCWDVASSRFGSGSGQLFFFFLQSLGTAKNKEWANTSLAGSITMGTMVTPAPVSQTRPVSRGGGYQQRSGTGSWSVVVLQLRPQLVPLPKRAALSVPPLWDMKTKTCPPPQPSWPFFLKNVFIYLK